MSRHTLTRGDVDYAALSTELSARLGRKLAVSAQDPGPDGPGVLVLIDDATGDEFDAPDEQVRQVVEQHVPPAPEPSPLDRLAAELIGADTLEGLKGALGNYVRREQAARGRGRQDRR